MVRQWIILGTAIVLAGAAFPAAAQRGGIRVDTQWTLEADGVHPGGELKAALDVQLQESFHVQSNKPLEDFLIPTELKFDPPEGFSVKEIVYPEPILIESAQQKLAVFEEKFAIGVLIAANGSVAPGEYAIPASLRYQACDDEKCLPPKTIQLPITLNVVAPGSTINPANSAVIASITFSGGAAPAPSGSDDKVPPPPPPADKPASPADSGDVLAMLDEFEVLGTAEGYMEPDKFIAFIDRAERGEQRKGFFEGKGPLAIIALVLIGGLALNLTPCVLPIIPINLAIIGAGAHAGSRTRGFALGGTYGLAMAAVYGVLGLVVILTAGTFGTINSSIWFNAAIAVLFVVLGLAMFDVIQIDFSRFQTAFNLGGAKKGSFVLAFGMGAISALLAGACVAPVVIQVIVYSGDQYAKGVTLALALPFFLGLGMALPWPFAGAGLSFLPKPGKWMVRVKQAMGVFILAFAAYYAYLAWEIFDARRVDPAAVASAMDAQISEGGWTPSLAAGLEQAKREDKLVIVDMWATWCKNCLVMDKTTFKDDAVIARLDGYVKVKFQAEDLDASPARDVLKRFDGFGLPTYAILRKKQ
jgi:cytochrome c biogenesis protein CcdA/DsbC/DsbD-like thiol-disulfide interchange protein/thiol-disulfide isomerase/thioredoxin